MNEVVESCQFVGKGASRGAVDQNICGCSSPVYLKSKSPGEEGDCQIKKVDLRTTNFQGEPDGRVLAIQ